jgi:hypothetical protein
VGVLNPQNKPGRLSHIKNLLLKQSLKMAFAIAERLRKNIIRAWMHNLT